MTAALGLVAAVTSGARLRSEPRVVAQAGGVTVERVDGALVPQGALRDARDGDLLLSNGELRIAVGSSAAASRAADHGAILEVTGPSFEDDSLDSLRTGLRIDGRPVELTVERVGAERGDVAPLLRIVSTTPHRDVVVTTDLSTARGAPFVQITTRVANRRATAIDAVVTDDVDWPGAPTFVPGAGEVEQSGRKTVEWFARTGPLSYGLVFPGGPAAVEFRAQQSETDQTAFGPVLHLPPRSEGKYERVLVATRRGLSGVARVAALLGNRPVSTITGRLVPAPAWARVSAVASDGSVVMKEEAREDGSFELVVPEGRHRVVLQAPGGLDETTVLVRSGERVSVPLVVPEAERLDFRITDPGGRGIPARIMVTGREGTPDPLFLSVPKLAADGNEIHTVTGDGRVDIPPGRYRVVVSRGSEWSIVEKLIDIRPEQGVALRATLSHVAPTPGFVAADLHLHARPSGDSRLSLEDRVSSLVSAGVEFAVATDHNHVTDYAPTIEELSVGSLLGGARGVEVTTKTWGHFNVYPLPAGAEPPPWKGVEPGEIFAAARRASPGGVIQANHPWRAGYGYFHRAALDEATGASFRRGFSLDFDVIEVVNGYELGDPRAVEANLVRYFALLNLGRRYTAVGSSDSHKLSTEWAGYPRTYVRVKDDRPGSVNEAEIAASLRAGHAVVSLGPFLDAHIGEAGPGDTARTTAGVVPLEIIVRAADWAPVSRVDVVVGGQIVESIDVGSSGRQSGLVWTDTLDLPTEHDCWVMVIARGERPLDGLLPGMHVLPFAFTNPIYVQVGG